MRIFLLIALLLPTLSVCAQKTYNADSVEQIFDTLPDSTRLREANNLMKYYMDVDFDKSMLYARKAFALKDHAPNKSGLGYTYVSWAIAQYNYGRYDSCRWYNLRALEIYQSQADTAKMAVVFNNLSSVSNALGDYTSGAYYAYKAFLVHSAKRNWHKAAIACLNVSSAYYQSGDYDTALAWARRGYENYNTADASESLGYALQIFVDVFVARKEVDSALHYIRQIKHSLQSYPNEYLETVNLVQRGDVHSLQGRYDSAIALYAKCIAFYEAGEMTDAVLHTHLSLARAYMGLREWDQAEQSVRRVLEKSTIARNKPMIVKSCALLSELFMSQKKHAVATEYYQLGNVYKDSIMNQSVRGSIEGRFLDVKLERETQARTIALTNLQQSNATIANQWKVIGGISAMLVLALAVAHSIRRASNERQRMNAELMESNHKLSELNREVNGLINTIVHDLKSPLNNVQGVLSLIKENGTADGETAELIAIANKSIANGHGIIHQLLAARELDESVAEFPCEEIEAKEFAEEIDDCFQGVAKQKDITLNTTSEPYRFTSNKWHLRRIVDNLLSNAIKFSPPGSVVKFSTTYADDRVIFRVEDQGPGFSTEDLGKIYGRFQKLSARPTGGEHSNGLGLATVRALVNRLHATIDLDTEPGRGSVFTVSVPAADK